MHYVIDFLNQMIEFLILYIHFVVTHPFRWIIYVSIWMFGLMIIDHVVSRIQRRKNSNK